MDLGITGRDQVAEHDANLPNSQPSLGSQTSSGVEEVLDLGFGKCSLCVQIPEKGPYKDVKELVGKNIVTSFTGLTSKYFAELEGVELKNGEEDDEFAVRRRLKTKIKYVGGSVEAACALGVADGIVDLVGEFLRLRPNLPLRVEHSVDFRRMQWLMKKYRIGRNNESSRIKSNRYSRSKYGRTYQIQNSKQSGSC